MGVAPAGQALAGTGHHHLLIDTPLPLDPTKQIPFSEHHRHYGKGQTSTLLDLAPGPHTLRLLFADFRHRPYFVYSPEIRITVAGPGDGAAPKIDPRHFDSSCEAWYEDELTRPKPPVDAPEIVNLRAGETVASPFNLRFGVDGWGVCAAGATVEHTGHFILETLQNGRVLKSQDLVSGATQTTVGLADGSYVLRLRFADARGGADLLRPSETPIEVRGQDRL